MTDIAGQTIRPARDRRSVGSAQGFTLPELVMATAIILIIGGLALTSIRTARASYQLHTSGYQISTKLDDARSNALKRNRPAWLLLDAQAQSLQVQTTGTGGATTNVGGPEFLSQDMQLVGVTTTQQVTFDAIGRPVNPPQTIQVQNVRTGQTRTITIASTGRITVQ